MTKEIMIACVFPGQGSQAVGMGLPIWNQFASVKQLFKEADDALNFSISRLCFEGPENELMQTINVQPAILVVSLACIEAIKEFTNFPLPKLAFTAGHSLGEYTAMVLSGVLKPIDALLLVRERGKLMQEAAQNCPGGMLAIIGIDEQSISEICAISNTEISNINAPGQIVISGSTENISKAKAVAESRGIRRLIPLKVSGAFHSRLMQPASEGLKLAIQRTHFNQPSIPVVSNVAAKPIHDAESMKSELIGQIVHCVQWQKSVEYMIASGINTFIEIGHGQVITNLIKRISSNVKVFNIDDINIKTQISDIMEYIS